MIPGNMRMFSGEMLIQWLDAAVPDWFALVAGIFTGVLGVFAIGLMVTLFAPAALAEWMLGIVFFCGASAGYRFWEKRKSQNPMANKFFCLTAGLFTALAAILVQISVDGRYFNTRPSVVLLLGLGTLGLGGAALGGGLRHRYEELPHAGK